MQNNNPDMFRITKTYSKVTEESAETGEFSDEGYVDEEGKEFSYDEEGIDEAVNYLSGEGVSWFDKWFSTEMHVEDYSSGESVEYDFFVKVDPENPYKEMIEKSLRDGLGI
jgi:hypothetical protein